MVKKIASFPNFIFWVYNSIFFFRFSFLAALFFIPIIAKIHIPMIWKLLKHFATGHSIKHKPLISEECTNSSPQRCTHLSTLIPLRTLNWFSKLMQLNIRYLQYKYLPTRTKLTQSITVYVHVICIFSFFLWRRSALLLQLRFIVLSNLSFERQMFVRHKIVTQNKKNVIQFRTHYCAYIYNSCMFIIGII